MFSMLIEAGTSSHAAPQSEHFYLFVLELKSFPQDAEKSTEKWKLETTLILWYWNLIWKKLCDPDT